MPPKRKPKSTEPRIDADLHAEWFPVYGIRMKDFPWVYLTGKTPEETMINLAGFVADQGKKLHKEYRVVFLNEPFEIE